MPRLDLSKRDMRGSSFVYITITRHSRPNLKIGSNQKLS